MDETPLQMARRHVREGRQRIARQEELLDELRRDRHEHMLPEGERVLQEMKEFQHEFEAHLAELEGRS